MRIGLVRRRSMRSKQGAFGFFERSRRRERMFKLVDRRWQRSRWYRSSCDSCSGTGTGQPCRPRSRSPPTESYRSRRCPARSVTIAGARIAGCGIELTRARVEQFYANASPAVQRLLRYAAMDSEHGLLRWGNVDWTILFSSKVFEADDTGRSFRLRPHTRSVWLHGMPLASNVPMFLLVPDSPELTDIIKGMPVRLIEASRQTTNSWGLRSPEPDLDATLRVLVLGDSYMQGLFIGDDETPSECLAARSARPLERRGIGSQHRPHGLLPRAVLLHAGGVCRPVSTPRGRDQPLRQ